MDDGSECWRNQAAEQASTRREASIAPYKMRAARAHAGQL
jgi:hypothetical protein